MALRIAVRSHLSPLKDKDAKNRSRSMQLMYEEFCVAACRFFIRQACVSDIRGLIVTPFNSELIYRHLDVPLLSVGDEARGNLGDHGASATEPPGGPRSQLPNSGVPSALNAVAAAVGANGSAIPIATHRTSQSKECT